MDNDLTDVGLNALDALEAQDEQEESTSTEEVDEKDTSTEEDTSTEDTSDDAGTDDSEGSEEETTEENSEEGETEDEPEKKEESKDMSDEEFEEMAKKRGYAKAKSEEETKQEDENKTTMEKLLARPKEIPDEVWEPLPEMNKVIYNALPYLVAEGKNGTIQVKLPDQLPEEFEFKNDRARMKFENDLQAQETRANEFKRAIESREERVQRETYERAEAQKVVDEINSLQKSGELPTPKATFGKEGFDNDPAVLLINKVLSYRAQRASEGVGLTVRDSLMLYKATHPEEFKQKEAKGDIERRNIAKKVAGNSKSTSSAVNGGDNNKPQYYKPGMSTEDVLDSVLNDMD